ncbi:hypothetical protein Tco_1052076 [Tanacetum coccineum]
MKLYIQGKDNGRIILNSVENGPLVWPTVALENGIVRPKTYEELSDKEKLQADCDLKATNIVLQGLPPDVYALVNRQKVAKDIWDRVKLLMQGTSLSKQEHECKLYDEFDKFSYVKGETLHQYYLRFSQLINDMNIIQMTMQPVQVNTKFLNSLPPEWGKFVTDVKLARDLHTSNYDQLYAYLEQHELCLHRVIHQPTINSDILPIRGIKPLFKMVELPFSKFKEDKVRMLSVQVHKGMLQCTQPKRRRDATWFKEKVLLVQAHAEGKELDNEQLTFLVDPGVVDNQVAQTITHNAAFQTDNLDSYDSDYDDISSAKAILMDNLSSCDSDVFYRDNEITSDSNIIPYSQYLEEMQQAIVQNTNTSAHKNSMILSMFEQMSNHATNWDKANNESKIVNESLTAELERYKKRVKILKQRFIVDLSGREKFIDSQMDDMIRMDNTKFAAYETEIDTLKQALSKHVKEKESLLTTLNGFKTEFKERESKSIDKEIVLENKNKELKNIVFQRIKPILYDGNVLSKTHDVLSVVDDEETLILAKESRLKLIMKFFFVPQQELSAEQMFWLQSSNKNSEEPSTSNTPVKIEVPSELPKVSLVNKSLKKLRFHLASFDKVVKVRSTPDAITERS